MAITHSTTEPILHPTHHLPIFSLSNHYLYTFFSLLFFSRELIDSEAGDIYHKTCGAGDPPYSRENLLLTYHFRYCCPKRTHAIVNRKSKFIRFRECFRRGVQTQSKRENRHKGVKRRRAMTYGRFVIHLCTHADHLALGNTDPPPQQADATTVYFSSGGRRASFGGGGAPNVDAPGSNFKLYPERTCDPILEGIIRNCPPIPFGAKAGEQRPENIGAVVVVRPLATCTGDLGDCAALLAVGCVLCTAVLYVIL